MENLENELMAWFSELKVSQENQDSVNNYLNLLKRKDEETYNHSIRVGVLGARMARHMHLDEKVFLFAGTLHDVGKSLLSPELLRKTTEFGEKDMQEMRKHPKYTYDLLRGIHDFSAEVALRHHEWQKEYYPKKLPRPRLEYSKSTKLMIDFYARVLSLADFYDAATERVNDKFGEKRKLYSGEVKALLLLQNPDQKHLIEDFYRNGIFGEDSEIPTTKIQDSLYDSVWKDWDGKRNPKEIRRYVSLACALEPLSEKIGCTTRETDAHPCLKLEYFIAAAVNIGDAFEELSKRILDEGKQPKLIYDLAYKAQAECVRNRAGGRINQGILEMLVPIVSAQMIYDRDYRLSVPEVLHKAEDVMKNTSYEDVSELVKMKRLAYDLCAYHDRKIPEYNVKNIYDYYNSDMKNSDKITGVKHNGEFVYGFSSIRKMYDSIMSSKKKGLNRKVEEAYHTMRIGEHKGVGEGLTADCAACAIYLVLSHHPRDKVIV